MAAAVRGAFDASSYVERKTLEERVVEQCRAWYDGRDRTGWISLRSAAGQGNTWLLHSLKKKIGEEFELRLHARTVLVPAPATAGGPPDPLTPLQAALVRPLRTPWTKWKDTAATAFRPGIFLAVVGFVVALLLLNAAGNYFPDTPDATMKGFVTIYLPQRAGVYFALLVAAGVVGAFGQLLKDAFQRRDETLSDADKEELITPAALAAGLRRHARRRPVLFVLVDRSHLLPQFDRGFIHDFLGSHPDPAVAALLFTVRVLFVTLDETEDWLTWRTPRTTLKVDPFTDEEILEIARRQRPDLHARLGEDDPEARSTVEEAKGNIHALLPELTQFIREAGDAFAAMQQRNPEPTVFAAESLMVYEAVRMIAGIGSTNPLKEYVRDWLANPKTAAHLAEFGVRPPSDPGEVLRDLDASRSIAQFLPRRIAFDLIRCRAMVEWARQAEKPLVARAYYFWMCDLLGEVTNPEIEKLFTTVPPQRRRLALKKAAWLAMELNECCDPRDLIGSLKPEHARHARRRIAVALLSAAVVYMREGESRLATSALEDLSDWLLPELLDSDELIVDTAMTVTWELYWLTADRVLRSTLDAIRDQLAAVAKRPSWRIESRFAELAAVKPSELWKPRRNAKLSAALHDRMHLTETLRKLRERRGFLFELDHDEWPDVPAPSTRHCFGATATALRALGIAAALGTPRAQDLLDHWSGAARTEIAAYCVGDEVLSAYDQGALAHARFRVLRKAGRDEEAAAAARQSVSAYERCLMLASLMSWRGLTAEVSYHFGALLTELAEAENRTERRDWEAWETVFQSALDIEHEAQWMIFTPDIHHLRWQVFRELAVETSLEDGYNTYVAAKAANLPRPVLVRLISTLCVDFTNGGDTSTDRLRDAELHEEWAEIAAWEEAKPYWRHSNLQFEQADALTYAAQGHRLCENYGRAEEVLDRAEEILPAEGLSEEEAEVARQLRASIAYQRVGLHIAQDRDAETDEGLRRIWGTLRLGDDLYPLILVHLVLLDSRKEILGDPWPVVDGALAPDPDAPDLSLTPEFLERVHITGVANRYEYRFWQLCQHLEKPLWSAEIRRAILKLASTGLEYSDLAMGGVRRQMVTLLEFARERSARLHYESAEIDALRLLVIATDDERYRSEYVQATLAYAQLVERERELAVRTPIGWYELAERIHHYLSVLIDKRLHNQDYVQTIVQSGRDPNEAFEAHKARSQAYVEAGRAFADRDHARCLAILTPALPPPQEPWVFWEDLRALNQWLAASAAVSPAAPQRSTVVQQLRASTMRYVQQLARTIPDQQGHLLAVRLQRVVEEALHDSARIPIAAEEDEPATARFAPAPRPSATMTG